MKLYSARHGESEANVQRIHWNQPHGYGLTDKGRAQAASLADRLAGVQFATLYCSPTLRAVQMAQIVGRQLDLTPQVVDALRERDVGILEGTGIESPGPAWQTSVQWMQHDNHNARTEGGESYALCCSSAGWKRCIATQSPTCC